MEGEPGVTETAKVLARHHGAEELREFDFGTKYWDADDLRKFIASADWFDPRVSSDTVHIITGDET